jgi:nucleotidyltransferase substrate binding protein, HI0074 family
VEKLNLRHNTLIKTLRTLEKTLEFEDYQDIRDSMIQRFEYSTDLFWKYLKDYLRVILRIEVQFARPKAVLKECADAKIITEDEFTLCVDMIEDRNLTSHAYHEQLTEEISQQLPKYFSLMNKILERLK